MDDQEQVESPTILMNRFTIITNYNRVKVWWIARLEGRWVREDVWYPDGWKVGRVVRLPV